MRVIFLDMDGVLNTQRSMLAAQAGIHPPTRQGQTFTVEADAVENLRALVHQTKACIVVSSSWRYTGLNTVRSAFDWIGWHNAPLIGETPCARAVGGLFVSQTRGAEIAEWLQWASKDVSSYVVLDDDKDAGVGHEARFVKTDFAVGLTRVDCARAATILATPCL